MKKMILLLLFIIGLSACGDGGGGTSGTPTPQGTPVNLAPMKNVLSGLSTYSFPTLIGTDSHGRAASCSFSLVGDGATTFEGQNVTKRRSLVTLQIAGGELLSGTTTSYYHVSDGSLYKSITDSGVISTPISQFPIPSTANVGEVYIYQVTKGSNGTTAEDIWSILPDFNGASILSMASTETTGNTTTVNEIINYYLNAEGIPTKVAVIYTSNYISFNVSGLRK